jgi:RNA polymerase sigma-70 factor, ECF subfamily
MIDRHAESQLLERARQGDEQAFAGLYEAHKSKVFAICLRIMREAADAEDCTQEAFLQFFRSMGSFRGEAALSTWLYRLTVNVALMRLREKRVNTVSLQQDLDPGNPGARTLADALPVPDLELTGAVDRIAIHRALGQLPLGYRTIFFMHEVGGLAHKEIARALGCSVGNSKSQLHQARLRLRKILRQLGRKPHPVPALS